MQTTIGSPEDVGRLVRHVRERHGLSQQDLADRLGVSQRWLSELELGKGKQANARYFAVLAQLGIRLSGTTEDDPIPGLLDSSAIGELRP